MIDWYFFFFFEGLGFSVLLRTVYLLVLSVLREMWGSNLGSKQNEPGRQKCGRVNRDRQISEDKDGIMGGATGAVAAQIRSCWRVKCCICTMFVLVCRFCHPIYHRQLTSLEDDCGVVGSDVSGNGANINHRMKSGKGLLESFSCVRLGDVEQRIGQTTNLNA